MLNPENIYIKFKFEKNKIELNFDAILYVKAHNDKIEIVTLTNNYLIRKTFAWFLTNVSNKMFQRCHKSYIINFNKIEKINSRYVLINEHEIAVSRKYKINVF